MSGNDSPKVISAESPFEGIKDMKTTTKTTKATIELDAALIAKLGDLLAASGTGLSVAAYTTELLHRELTGTILDLVGGSVPEMLEGGDAYAMQRAVARMA